MIGSSSSLVNRYLLPRLATTTTSRFPRRIHERHVATNNGAPTTCMKLICTEDLDRLNRTTVALYRLLLKESRAIKSRRTEYQKTKDLHGRVLLQPPVNPSNYGRTQELAGVPTLCDPSADDQDDCYDTTAWNIIEFFHRQSEESKNGGTSTILTHIPSLRDHLIPKSESVDRHQQYIYHLVSPDHLVHAVRSSFLRMRDVPESVGKKARANLTKNDIIVLQRRAIDAVRILHEQLRLSDCTSIGVNEERGVRVFATSRFKGKTVGNGKEEEHFFVYRIRVENINKTDDCNLDDQKAVRLLGRKWKISDPAHGEDNCEEVINAPRTGVVGYHPVIQPGSSFEYMSGCNILSSVGYMEGCFYMCMSEQDDETLRIGDDDLEVPKDEDNFFQVPIESFLMDSGK